MSTTFEIYPVNSAAPNYKNIIETAESFISSCLSKFSIPFKLQILVKIHHFNEKYNTGISPLDPFILKENEYAWFYYESIPGGTDSYFREIDDDMKNDFLHKELLNNNRSIQNIVAKIEQIEKNHKYWYFRRSAGQPAIINLTYGMLAASLAKYTEGIIYSDDNAWSFQKFPCEYEEFLSFYFNPNNETNGNEFNEWSERCIKEIRKQMDRY